MARREFYENPFDPGKGNQRRIVARFEREQEDKVLKKFGINPWPLRFEQAAQNKQKNQGNHGNHGSQSNNPYKIAQPRIPRVDPRGYMLSPKGERPFNTREEAQAFLQNSKGSKPTAGGFGAAEGFQPPAGGFGRGFGASNPQMGAGQGHFNVFNNQPFGPTSPPTAAGNINRTAGGRAGGGAPQGQQFNANANMHFGEAQPVPVSPAPGGLKHMFTEPSDTMLGMNSEAIYNNGQQGNIHPLDQERIRATRISRLGQGPQALPPHGNQSNNRMPPPGQQAPQIPVTPQASRMHGAAAQNMPQQQRNPFNPNPQGDPLAGWGQNNIAAPISQQGHPRGGVNGRGRGR